MWTYLHFDPRTSPSQPDDLSSEAKEGGRGTKGRGEVEKGGGTATPEYERQDCWDICGCCRRCVCSQSHVVHVVVQMKFEVNHFPPNIHTHTHTHTCTCTHTYTCTHTHTSTYKHTYTHKHTRMHTHTHKHTHTHYNDFRHISNHQANSVERPGRLFH